MGRILILRDSRSEYRASIGEDGRVSIDGVTVAARVVAPGEVRVGETAHAWVSSSGDIWWVFLDGEVFEIEVQAEGRRRRAAASHGSLSAPMPATVVRVEVSPGTAVRRGDTLVILEAMKMELPIRASSDGIVNAVHCKPGDLVQPGVVLIDIESCDIPHM
jgi:acetyl/propionyl-CoA carboxylase alpha subunit